MSILSEKQLEKLNSLSKEELITVVLELLQEETDHISKMVHVLQAKNVI